MRSIFALLTCVAATGSGSSRADEPAFAPIGRMDTAVIRESSGIVKSPKHEGIFWTHNDSGNPPELFAIRLDGSLVARVPVTGAPNLDWEDIAASDGSLYVGDIGNNHGWLHVRMVYRFAEPDPFAKVIRPIQPMASYRYKFPDHPFDAEALIVRDEQIYLIRKGGGKASAIYRLVPSDDEYMKLEEVQPLRLGWICAADLSADGRDLVAVSGRQLARFPVNPDLTLRADEPPKFVTYPGGGQIEACCHDGDDVILTGERGGIYRIPAADIDRQTRFARPPVR